MKFTNLKQKFYISKLVKSAVIFGYVMFFEIDYSIRVVHSPEWSFWWFEVLKKINFHADYDSFYFQIRLLG